MQQRQRRKSQLSEPTAVAVGEVVKVAELVAEQRAAGVSLTRDVWKIRHHSEEHDCDACGRPLDVGDLAYPENRDGLDPCGRSFCSDTCRSEARSDELKQRRRNARAALSGNDAA